MRSFFLKKEKLLRALRSSLAPEVKAGGMRLAAWHKNNPQGSGAHGSEQGRDDGVPGGCDASSWWVEAELCCGLCRYFLLHDQGERPCPVRQQQCQTCAACTPLALRFIWKLLSSLALFQSSSITNVSAFCLQILWRWVPNHTTVPPEEVWCTGQLTQREPEQNALLLLNRAGQGLMGCRKRGQEENKEHCYVPGLTVHPQSILTQEGTNFFYSIHKKP